MSRRFLTHSFVLCLCTLGLSVLGLVSSSFAADEHILHSFDRVQLSDQFWSEGATIADVDGDKAPDVIAGPYWYAGPSFKKRTEFYPAKPFSINGYSDHFFTFSNDIDGDGWVDILVVGFPGKEAFWYQNPQNKPGHWKQHLAFPVVDNESPTYLNLIGDEQPELVFHTGGQLGYASPEPGKADQPWKFTPISADLKYQRFTHGLGVGDVNGDGRYDILEKNGWWEQPAADSDQEFWTQHKVQFSGGGGSQMYAYDVDGDGDNDVITGKAAHGYGLAWFENKSGKEGVPEFEEHRIMGDKPEHNKYGIAFSQLHAVALADMDGDGIKDIVTGKRFWAHQGHDPGAHEPVVSYWFKIVRDKNGVDFLPYQIDTESGVGTHLHLGDATNNGLLDLVVGNKKGTFVLIHHADKVNENTWKRGQPVEFQKEASAKNDPPTLEDDKNAFVATAPDGAKLNLDFETGNLNNWVATGDAFARQPIKGDTVKPRRDDMESRHSGDYWIGTFEIAGDRPQGTLTSVTVKVTHPYASFLIGGGGHRSTRVDLVRRDSGQTIFSARGRNNESMHRVVADLRPHLNKEIFVRVVDENSGHWGHINFDHFRFHSEKPQLANAVAKQKPKQEMHNGLPAKEAAAAMTLPPGFKVTAFAAEPDVRQPIAMTLDDRGRLWVAEAYAYPIRRPENEAKDRILIFEDVDGDGQFDKRKVFIDKLNLVSGLEVGFGGVWIGQAPYLLFVPDKDGDDVPDSKPQILLDGWHYEDTHETLNAFIWGPDGWLYGCHGVFTHSRVGKPGTPDSERTPLNAGIWRYHPTRHEFELFAEGTSNPWGVDFNDHGQSFLSCCVIPHLFHVIQGGRFRRQAGKHFNPYTYDDIKTIAKHRHWVGNQWSNPDRAASDDAGGGHAHAGAMFYLGGSWPQKYRNQLFMNNIHGARLNVDKMQRQGSGYVGDRAPDFLLANDVASQILYFRYGPDGQVYFIDWYDSNQCHHRGVEKHDRNNGRIFKITYRDAPAVQVDLKKFSNAKLIELQLHENDWFVRHARRLLQERGVDEQGHARMEEIAFSHADSARRLRGLWALHVTDGLTPVRIQAGLTHSDEYVRAWTIQLAIEDGNLSASELSRLVEMARSDASPVVRLYLASAAQRIDEQQRWPLIEGLTSHEDDASDHNLPLMYWYALEPLVADDMQRAASLAEKSKIPLVKSYVYRRIADMNSPEAIAFLVKLLGETTSDDDQNRFLDAIQLALKGRRQFPMPGNWSQVANRLGQSENAKIKGRTQALSVVFGDMKAQAELRTLLADSNANLAERKNALEALLGAGDTQLVPTLQKLIADKSIRREALRGLAAYDATSTSDAILKMYGEMTPDEKRDALATLVSRSQYAQKLIDAIEAKSIPRTDLTAEIVRQMVNLKDERLIARLEQVWGVVRTSPVEKQRMIKGFKKIIEGRGPKADVHLGRSVFARTCAQCHKLFGTGGEIGPELTGSNRRNLDYLLSNVIDPSAVMAKDYQPAVVITESGRTLTGIIKKEDANSITVVTATETVIIPRNEIDEISQSTTSMMPDNLWKPLSRLEVRSLVAYLRGDRQVSMLADEENAKSFFNGRDLTGWIGDPKLWSVEDNTIVGRSPGIRRNSFLVSNLLVGDFELNVSVKLTPDDENSGIQFRSELLDGGDVRGYQADMGQTWWGKLYEEHGRAILWDKSATQYVKRDDWNDYRIVAVGHHVKTYLNGNLCVDLYDPQGATRGQVAVQIHSGGPLEVRFKNPQLTIIKDGKMPE